MIRAAGIICKPNRELVSSVVPTAGRWLRERKIEVFVDQETHECVDLRAPGARAGSTGAQKLIC